MMMLRRSASKPSNGVDRRTPSRRTCEEIEALVLDCLVRSNTPVGAYDISNRLRADGHSIVPNQVYRTLTRLMEKARVLRLESLSAYMVRHEQYDACLICDDCRSVTLTSNPDAVAQLLSCAQEFGFKVDKTVIETHGRCPSCVAQAGRNRGGTASPAISSSTA